MDDDSLAKLPSDSGDRDDASLQSCSEDGSSLPASRAGHEALHSLKMATPCGIEWDTMIGDFRKRRCQRCGYYVFKLHDASSESITELFERQKRKDPTIEFLYRRTDNTYMMHDCFWRRYFLGPREMYVVWEPVWYQSSRKAFFTFIAGCLFPLLMGINAGIFTGGFFLQPGMVAGLIDFVLLEICGCLLIARTKSATRASTLCLALIMPIPLWSVLHALWGWFIVFCESYPVLNGVFWLIQVAVVAWVIEEGNVLFRFVSRPAIPVVEPTTPEIAPAEKD